MVWRESEREQESRFLNAARLHVVPPLANLRVQCYKLGMRVEARLWVLGSIHFLRRQHANPNHPVQPKFVQTTGPPPNLANLPMQGTLIVGLTSLLSDHRPRQLKLGLLGATRFHFFSRRSLVRCFSQDHSQPHYDTLLCTQLGSGVPSVGITAAAWLDRVQLSVSDHEHCFWGSPRLLKEAIYTASTGAAVPPSTRNRLWRWHHASISFSIGLC